MPPLGRCGREDKVLSDSPRVNGRDIAAFGSLAVRLHHYAHALARPSRRETEHMFGVAKAQIVPVQPLQNHPIGAQQPRARHIGPSCPAGRAIGFEIGGRARAGHGHGDRHGNRDEPARGRDGRPFPEDAAGTGVEEKPPPEDGRRRVDGHAPQIAPCRTQLRLKSEPPSHPLRRTSGRDEHDEGNMQDMAPEDFRGGHEVVWFGRRAAGQAALAGGRRIGDCGVHIGPRALNSKPKHTDRDAGPFRASLPRDKGLPHPTKRVYASRRLVAFVEFTCSFGRQTVLAIITLPRSLILGKY